MENQQIQEFFDPHFHIWDLSEVHDAILLPKLKDSSKYDGANCLSISVFIQYYSEYEFNKIFATYYLKDYLEMVKNDKIKIIGGVVLESISACYKDLEGEDYDKKCRQELELSEKEIEGVDNFYSHGAAVLEDSSNNYKILNNLVDFYQKSNKFVGIRQILNFEPDWPRNKQDLSKKTEWAEGLKILAQRNVNFDLQLNPHQYQRIIDILKGLPKESKSNFIIDHLGTPHISQVQDSESVYWSGMKQFAQIPNLYIKISNLCLIDKKWKDNEIIISAVQQIIQIFGPDRCMFATNYPVDHLGQSPIDYIVEGFEKICKEFDQNTKDKLYKHNAQKAYLNK